MLKGFYFRSTQVEKLARFLGTGVLNTVFGYTVYAGLLFVEVPYLTALFVATVAGVIFNYFSFGQLVFGMRTQWKVFAKFVIAYFLIYLANALLLSALKEKLLIDPLLGQIFCIPPSILASWLLMNLWVYKNGKRSGSK